MIQPGCRILFLLGVLCGSSAELAITETSLKHPYFTGNPADLMYRLSAVSLSLLPLLYATAVATEVGAERVRRFPSSARVTSR